MRALRKSGWLLGLLALLCALLATTKIIQPGFGASGLESLARAALPFAFATAGMAVVVIAGGIDLSIASMMAVASVFGAAMMQDTGETGAIPVVLGVLTLGVAMGALNGGAHCSHPRSRHRCYTGDAICLGGRRAPDPQSARRSRGRMAARDHRGRHRGTRVARVADELDPEVVGVSDLVSRTGLDPGRPLPAGPLDLCHRKRSPAPPSARAWQSGARASRPTRLPAFLPHSADCR